MPFTVEIFGRSADGSLVAMQVFMQALMGQQQREKVSASQYAQRSGTILKTKGTLGRALAARIALRPSRLPLAPRLPLAL